MADETPDIVLDELTGWARARPASPLGDAEAVELLLSLLRDDVGVRDLGELKPGDLDELLLEVYPRDVTALRPEDVAGVIPTVRELVAFLGDTGRVSAKRLTQLDRAVDRIEPRFPDAMMDPARWGPVRVITQAMVADGVDPSDPDAVSDWVERNDDIQSSDPDLFEPDDDEDFLDLKEAFGLPDRLPPLRLPAEDELAALARGSRPLDRAKQLALWAGEVRQLAEDGELTAADTVDAAAALGVEVPEQASNSVHRMADVPELAWLWWLAEDLEFVEVDEMVAAAGPGLADWPDGDDEDVLDSWQTALAGTLEMAIDPDDSAGPDGLQFAGIGAAVALMLFLAGGEGIPRSEITEVIRESATEDLAPELADTMWRQWVVAHGEPVDALLARLIELDAVEVRDDVATLTPLSRYALRLQLLESGVDVPLLPPVAEMTAADLVAAAAAASEDELAAEAAAWLASRTAGVAVEELLTVAAAGEPVERMVAVSIATQVATPAEAQWRRALDDPRVRPYAKVTLAELAGVQPEEAPSELVLTPADLAWLLTDTLAGLAEALEPDELVGQLGEAVPAGQEQLMFDEIQRLDHPRAYDVLALIGSHHPDAKIAKAARRAAFKAQPPGKRS